MEEAVSVKKIISFSRYEYDLCCHPVSIISVLDDNGHDRDVVKTYVVCQVLVGFRTWFAARWCSFIRPSLSQLAELIDHSNKILRKNSVQKTFQPTGFHCSHVNHDDYF